MLDEVGLVDTFRNLYPEKKAYSWWSYMRHARQNDLGWRIDYVLVSKAQLDKVKSSQIIKEAEGSDHCPV